jgi:hypothetical protein
MHYQVLLGPEDMGDVLKIEMIQSCVRLNGVIKCPERALYQFPSVTSRSVNTGVPVFDHHTWDITRREEHLVSDVKFGHSLPTNSTNLVIVESFTTLLLEVAQKLS